MFCADRCCQAIALEGVNRQADACCQCQGAALKARCDHERIGVEFAHVRAQCHGFAVPDDKALRLNVIKALEERVSAQALSQLQRQCIAVGDRLASGKDTTGQLHGAVGQRGLHAQALLVTQYLLGILDITAQPGGHSGELGGAAVDDQLAGRAQRHTVELGTRIQIRERSLAQCAQCQQPVCGALIDGRTAVVQERDQPLPLVQAPLGLEAQRAVWLEQPAQSLERHTGVCQGRHKAVTQLPAIGTACALCKSGFSFDHGDLEARFQQ